MPGFPILHHHLLEFAQTVSIESVMLSNHFILCHPLLLLPSIFPNIRVFSSESVLYIRWPKYWSFSLNTSPSNEHPGLISFRMNWLDLLAVQETLKSLHQHHSSVQFSLVAQSSPTLCDPMNRSTPGLPVHYQLPELTQTHIHRVGDAIQPSHPLSSPFPPAPNPSQHHSSKASVLRHSTFFVVQLLHPYMTTGKNHSLD